MYKNVTYQVDRSPRGHRVITACNQQLQSRVLLQCRFFVWFGRTVVIDIWGLTLGTIRIILNDHFKIILGGMKNTQLPKYQKISCRKTKQSLCLNNCLVNSIWCWTNRLHFPVRVYCNGSQMTSQRVKNKKYDCIICIIDDQWRSYRHIHQDSFEFRF